MRTFFTASISENVILIYKLSFIHLLIDNFWTKSSNISKEGSFRLFEAASIESAIMTIEVSLEKGLGPG